MKNYFRLAILSILGISLLSSCANFKKSCNAECSKSKKEEVKTDETKTQEVKKVKMIRATWDYDETKQRIQRFQQPHS